MSPISVYRCFLTLLLTGFVQGSAIANGLPEIEYATPDQSIWTIRTNKDGEPDNPLTPVAAALFVKAGIPWHGRAYPAARMFKYLGDGTARFTILVKSPALAECCLLSKKPLAFAEIRAYHLAGTAPIKSPQDLLDKNIIVIHGYSYGGLLNSPGTERNRVGNNLALTHPAAFRMLAQGRADYVIDYAGPAAEVLAVTPLPGLQSELLSRQEVYLVLSKRYPEAEKVMERLETIADTLDVDKLMRQSRK